MTARPVRLVSFDLDETLWEFLPMMDRSLRSTIAALAERRPQLAPAVTVEELHRVRAEVADERAGTYEELREESFRRVLAVRGCRDAALARWMVEHWMGARVGSVELHDDVRPAIDDLRRRGFVVGAITNGNFPLHRHALAERFAFIVHAERVGEFKPAPGPFRLALELAGAAAVRSVHVGDSLETDVAGAHAAGWRAVWLNRAGAEPDPAIRPHAVVASLRDIGDVVERVLAAE